MLVKRDEKLSKYSLMRVGGNAKNLYIPQNKDEIKKLVSELENMEQNYRVISGGSNILISDLHEFEHVIYMGECNKAFEKKENGEFYVGASIRLQYLINEINKLGYGGIEYLFSVPGMVGGAIVMNAGRGKKYNQAISDYILSVEVLHNGKIETISKKDCRFLYRESVFKNSGYIILGVNFKFVQIEVEKARDLREARIKYSKENHETSKPNLGSLLKKGNPIAYFLLKKMQVGYKDGIHFSGKTNNWLVNEGKGNYSQAVDVIEQSRKLHALMLCKQELEVIVWD